MLAIVLIGKGSSALQEAGYLPVTPWAGFPRIELLGFYPTGETLVVQLVMVALLVLGFAYNRAMAGRSSSA